MLTAAARSTRARIVEVAMRLLVDGGREAVSTRAVCSAAQVQAPTIYRLFGDKEGLLDAVAAEGFAAYLSTSAMPAAGPDPVDDMRRGWDAHVVFGLDHPYLYSLAYGGGRPGSATPAARATEAVLAAVVHRVAVAGRLAVPEHRAVQLLHAACCGMTLTLIATPPDRRDRTLSDQIRDATMATTTTGGAPRPEPGPASAAVHLRAVLPASTALSGPERGLLTEWLDRISAQG